MTGVKKIVLDSANSIRPVFDKISVFGNFKENS